MQADYNYEIGVEIRPTRIKGSNLVYVSRQITGEDEAPDWILGAPPSPPPRRVSASAPAVTM